MIGQERSKRLDIVVSSGSGTGTLTGEWAIARWIRVIPVSESDTFDLTLKDGEGDIISTRTSQLGTMSERLEISLGILKVIQISNAIQDGTYRFKADLH